MCQFAFVLHQSMALELDPDCLPWKAPAWLYRIQSLVKGKGVVSSPPPLTDFSLSLTKKSNIDQ